MAEIIQHPRNPDPPPPNIEEPNETDEELEDNGGPDEPQPSGDLEIETAVLISMLKGEIGLRWMSIELRFQIEKIELLIGQAGTVATF